MVDQMLVLLGFLKESHTAHSLTYSPTHLHTHLYMFTFLIKMYLFTYLLPEFKYFFYFRLVQVSRC